MISQTHFGKRATVAALAFITAISLSFPSLAFAQVSVDGQELAQGDNAIGGGTATLTDVALDMVDVIANELYIDQDLTVNFNGGNEIDDVVIEGSANVELNFDEENEVSDVFVNDNADLTINADGHNEFEEVIATGDSQVTINVTDENEFETIIGENNATIVIKGTECQMKDTIELGDDEDDAEIATENGNLVIDHVTIEIESEKDAYVGSAYGDVTIDTSKIEADDTEYTLIAAGKELKIIESVIEIKGTLFSVGKMTIEHSDVEVEKAADEYDVYPYRVFSATGIELIREENGEVKETEIDGVPVWYVDTDDGDDVELEADGKPAYYKCKDGMPATGDGLNIWSLVALSIASAVAAGYAGFAARRRMKD